jgi:diaminohydroxyphosphoribosylaminopyrimidine deaminase / 5-amino-6-(5-phosphoribosylamino)uracil reductase
VAVTAGVMADRCLDLIWPFVASDCFARPYVELKTATSLDGRFARPDDPAGRPGYLTGPEARADVHVRRRWVDMVIVGAGTARHDHPSLDTRLVPPGAACPHAEPLAGCVAGARTDGGDLRLNRPAWFCFYAGELPAGLPAGAVPVACRPGPGGVDPRGLLEACAARGWRTIMLEGGPALAASFLAAGLVDRWVQYVAPVVVGEGPSWPAEFVASAAGAPPSGFHLTCRVRIGPDLRVIWDRWDFAAVARAHGG